MYCRKCGKEAKPGDLYCSGCGVALKTDEAAVEDRKRRGFLLTLACAVLVFIVGIWMLSGGRPEETLQAAPTQPTAAPTLPARTEPQSQPTQTEPPRTEPAAEDPEKLVLAWAVRSENGTEKNRVQYLYDEAGNIAWMDDGEGHQTQYSYHANGKLAQETVLFQGQTQSLVQYDVYGNRVQTDTHYYVNTYDEQDRLTDSLCYTTGHVMTERRHYVYNSDGSYDEEFTDYVDGILHCHKYTSYDPEGRVITGTQDLESGMDVQYQTDNYWDEYGNLERTTLTSDTGGEYSEHITDYVNILGQDGSLLKSEIYITARQIRNGEETEQIRTLEKHRACIYDASGRLICQEDSAPDGSWCFVYTWEYDSRGNLIRTTEGNEEVVVTYTYLPLEEVQYS